MFQTTGDLNAISIPTDSAKDEPLTDYSMTVPASGTVSVYLRGLESRLIDHIKEADTVVGCVAWLTSFPILEALSNKRGVSLVVQKEDFLRPDTSKREDAWRRRLRAAYFALPPMERYELPVPLRNMSVCCDPTIEAVRCVGNHNSTRKPAFPRSHHKFVLFGRYEITKMPGGYESYRNIPYAVWTGSFNFTDNATKSFENALVLTDSRIVEAFAQEHAQIAALSEPLDWTSNWAEPEWRIGT